MNVVAYLCGTLVGTLVGVFLARVVVQLLIRIDKHKKYNKYKIDYDRFIQAEYNWVLTRQPSDKEIKEMFSGLPDLGGDDYGNMFKSCAKLEHVPEISQEVFEKNNVTIGEIHEALCEIKRQRIEDNKPNIIKFFNHIFNN